MAVIVHIQGRAAVRLCRQAYASDDATAIEHNTIVLIAETEIALCRCKDERCHANNHNPRNTEVFTSGRRVPASAVPEVGRRAHRCNGAFACRQPRHKRR